MDAERNPVGKAAPVFALAYCHRDADAAARWLAWVAFLAAEKEPTVRHDLVVMRTRRMAGAKIEQLVPGVRVTQAVCPDEDERGVGIYRAGAGIGAAIHTDSLQTKAF